MSSGREQEECWGEIARTVENISKCISKEKGNKEKEGNKRRRTDRHILRQTTF